MTAGHRSLSRRRLLGAAAGAAALVGVGQTQRSAAEVLPVTYRDLVSDPVFVVAHRGGGGEWPEMTRYAYRRALWLPNVRAIEVSVRLTADGVLVCSHDDNLIRTTGVDVSVAESDWATLAGLRVDASETVNRLQPSRGFTRFEDVLSLLTDQHVIFVEPKSRAANPVLMERMVAWGAPERVVWKQPVNSKTFAEAKDNGFATWGYVLDEPAHLGDNLERYAASDDIDLLGAPRSGSDDLVSEIVAAAKANGKQTMMWEIRNLTDRARALRLGCTGLMASAITTISSTPL